MKEKKPLLSICIPTYNRAYLLKESLSKLLPICQKYNIEVYVSDNASPDGTYDLLVKLKEIYSCLDFYRQNENIGSDKNFEFVIKNASGKYRWTLGDSTYITEKSLLSFIALLKENIEYKFYVLGFLSYINNNEKQVVYYDANVLLRDIGWHMTWISCLVYHESIIEKLDFQRYYESSFIQTGVIFEYLAHNTTNVMYCPQIPIETFPNIEKRGHWLPHAFEVFCKKWTLFIYSLPVYYSYESKAECIMKHGIKADLFTLKGLLYLRRNKYLCLEHILKYKKFIKCTVRYNFLFLILISLIPAVLLNTLSKTRKLLITRKWKGFA